MSEWNNDILQAPYGESVLVYVNRSYRIASYFEGKWWTDCGTFLELVDYWMPLPKPPTIFNKAEADR